MFQINVKAPFMLSQRAFAVMKRRQWGRIVNISNIGVKYGGAPNSIHYPRKDMAAMVNMIPLKRMAEPAEIAETVYFLSSEKYSYITGSVVTVAGGE
tara:strand:- start:575 stop:865 length:291 start_codon:yes stop_codon:yes gene_type:complete